ncbi:histidine phosphatase superfamily-domain-containing protein [Mycotypha africana]|uniref:histidine phosphatase superfamily-domain-containing protein n=1 Tax=Mycotypha africana TaxID=64632 RepID=UPI0023009F5C|nr:histidine phosphatase superfamily-domain-containing protein [Mycotypha africana]KAI8987307.1 histidine phosphatase superfamily-domain-containing protein [Mycotypha africana]
MPAALSPSPLKRTESTSKAQYVIGVCAMDKKARSKPMRYILDRMLTYGDFEIVIFGDKTIIDEEVENWPGCDFLLCFFSAGFPLDKAIQYVKLRKPFIVNDVCMQSLLWDRRVVMAILDAAGVPTPPRLVISRDGGAKVDPEAAEAFHRTTGMDIKRVLGKYSKNTKHCKVSEEGVEVDGAFLPKTFLEKPVDSEDHNINIYYDRERGGGGRRLFRKIGNKSSEFDPHLNIPHSDGSWVYESLMMTENSEDVKVYTVGASYVHAETRKSPTVDGLVKRNTEGKEIRYVAELTHEEKMIAGKVSKAFGQMICGFDLLRVKGKSYVIDVNGWSFVKGNEYYYDQCAKLLSQAFLRSVQRRPSISIHDIPREILPENAWRLKGFAAVFRHADRTPKSKHKISLVASPFVDLLEGSTQEVVFRQKHQLQLVIDAIDKCLDRKLENEQKLLSLKEILDRKKELPGTKVQVKPIFDKDSNTLKKLQVNVKWGGEFTHAGLHQSRDLGENLRKDMKILNKHVTDDIKIWSSSERRVRATADVFTRYLLGRPESIEGVISESKYLLDDSNAAKEQMDAVKKQLKVMLRPGYDIPAALLAQCGWPADLPQPHAVLQKVSTLMARLRTIMRINWCTKDVEQLQRRWCCFESPTLFKERWEKLFQTFCSSDDMDTGSDSDATAMVNVAKTEEEEEVQVQASAFCPDPSGVPELYDSLKYDALHNRQFLEAIFSEPEGALTSDASTPIEIRSNTSSSISSDMSNHYRSVEKCEKGNPDLRNLYTYVRVLFNFIAPQEYGISEKEKKSIGLLISLPLLKSILRDLEDFKASEKPKTRLYFTKESHVHTLLNLVYLSGLPTKYPRPVLPELDFLTQITFELYERNRHNGTEKEYSLRIAFSSGAHYDCILDLHMDAEHCLKVAPRRNLIPHLSLDEVLQYYKTAYLRIPELANIEKQIEERKLYYAQEDNQ